MGFGTTAALASVFIVFWTAAGRESHKHGLAWLALGLMEIGSLWGFSWVWMEGVEWHRRVYVCEEPLRFSRAGTWLS